MIIETDSTSGCAGSDTPMTIRVSDCDNCSSITWEFTNLPAGAARPTVTQIGDSCVFEVSAPDAGAYELRGTCNG